ncbi:uncharacterized protein LOC129600934 isoform X1 [Paramacrobiotus metropolitanus]|uniref:uncharacterized protein LOC129600934 isoform X1 n=1 Tax=Paramacrobiotus metropolitanus TaxID=2943436 RepID=UPI002445CD5F|nr:uncharacterized protein LOC129600934 isoform X1 [Paramacrobiotus metropolitanus]
MASKKDPKKRAAPDDSADLGSPSKKPAEESPSPFVLVMEIQRSLAFENFGELESTLHGQSPPDAVTLLDTVNACTDFVQPERLASTRHHAGSRIFQLPRYELQWPGADDVVMMEGINRKMCELGIQAFGERYENRGVKFYTRDGFPENSVPIAGSSSRAADAAVSHVPGGVIMRAGASKITVQDPPAAVQHTQTPRSSVIVGMIVQPVVSNPSAGTGGGVQESGEDDDIVLVCQGVSAKPAGEASDGAEAAQQTVQREKKAKGVGGGVQQAHGSEGEHSGDAADPKEDADRSGHSASADAGVGAGASQPPAVSQQREEVKEVAPGERRRAEPEQVDQGRDAERAELASLAVDLRRLEADAAALAARVERRARDRRD